MQGQRCRPRSSCGCVTRALRQHTRVCTLLPRATPAPALRTSIPVSFTLMPLRGWVGRRMRLRVCVCTRRSRKWRTSQTSDTGTFLDGVRLTPGAPTPLSDHSRLVFGQCTLEFRLLRMTPSPTGGRHGGKDGRKRSSTPGVHHDAFRHTPRPSAPKRRRPSMDGGQQSPVASSPTLAPSAAPIHQETSPLPPPPSPCHQASVSCGKAPTTRDHTPTPCEQAPTSSGQVPTACHQAPTSCDQAPTAPSTDPTPRVKAVSWSPHMLRVHEVPGVEYPPDYFEATQHSVIFRNMIEVARGEACGEAHSP